MYESPIDCFVTQFNMKRREFEEKQILEAVQGVGVNVDKHELEKALRYDREQYKKGYADGAKEFAERLKGTALDTHFSYASLIYELREEDIDDLVKEMVGEASG